jgi:hypothetical protein
MCGPNTWSSFRLYREVILSARKRFLQEVSELGLPGPPASPEPVDPSYIASLPEPARRYLDFMNVARRPRDWSFRVGFTGRFRLRPRDPWMACEAWQYNSRLALARVFHIRMRLYGVIPVLARDTYLEGRGRMLVRMADLFTVADGTGEEYNIGELVTYLNDAVLIAPSMLLVPEVSWASATAASFDLTLRDQGRRVTARVEIDENGAPKEFHTSDRFYYDPGPSKQLIRASWSTPVTGWHCIDGLPRPADARAVWHLPEGPFEYADFRPIPGSLVYNVPPGN